MDYNGSVIQFKRKEGFILSIFEALMLICFGAAWPINIYKSWKTRSAVGKSLGFQVVILIGYAFGITHKILNDQDIVLYLYVLNFIMVSIDTAIYFRNKKLDRERAPQTL